MTNMQLKYDAFYASPLQRTPLAEIQRRKWPRNRQEAIVAVTGCGKNILDIGCGSGQLLYQFRHRFKALVGLELSLHRLEQARTNLQGLPFLPIHGTAEDMSMIKTGSIDQIISSDTIEHIPDVFRAFMEMHRVLSPNGRVLINTPNIAFIKKRILLLLGRFPSTSQPNEGLGSDILFDGGHLHYFTFRSLRLLLEHGGFKVVQTLGYGKFGFLHNILPSLLSGGIQLVAIKNR